VRLQITTAPKIDTEDVPVYLRIMDVDDPDGDPIDKDGDGTATVNDNYGVGRIPETAMVFRETTTVQTTAQVSHAPGDNYRVAASTHRERLAELKPSPNSQTGEVFDLQLNPVEEQVEMSEMITVWRRLNLEIDSMAAPPTDPNDPERNFVEGTVTEIVSDNAGGVARVFIRADPAVPGMSNLTDGSPDRSWEPPDFGEGRFENGRVFWGGDVNENFAERVAANGTDYIEGPLRLVFTAQPVSGGVISAGRVVSGRPSDGLFRVRPGTAGFPAGNTEPVRFQIGATSWTVPAGGIGPGTPVGGPSGSELEYSVTVAEMGRPLRFRLLDDDQAEAPFEIDLSLLQASDSAETNAFAGAYIRPRRIEIQNAKVAPFNRNVECPAIGPEACDTTEARATLGLGRDGPEKSGALLVAYLLGAYQGRSSNDGDPNGEQEASSDVPSLVTGTEYSGKGAMVFVEALREASVGCGKQTTAHEVGHLLGLGHVGGNADLMSNCSALRPSHISSTNIKLIRKLVRP